MKPTPRRVLLALTLLGAMAPLTAPTAGAANNRLFEHALQIQAEQRAPQFNIDGTVYQLVPDVALVPHAKVPSGPDTHGTATLSTRDVTASPTAVSRIGPYAIVLPGKSQPLRARSADAARVSYAVAVNMKTGQPVLVRPELQLQVREAGQGQALADALGGILLFDGPTSRIVVVGFDSVNAALQALSQARTLEIISHAQPALQRRFNKPR